MATYARNIHTITFSPFIMLAGTPRACSMTGINAYWCVLRLFPIDCLRTGHTVRIVVQGSLLLVSTYRLYMKIGVYMLLLLLARPICFYEFSY